jgi:hypothetical protein
MITVYNRSDYDCCTAFFQDDESKVRIHFHKADGHGVDVRQILLESAAAGPIISLNVVPPHGRVDCDEWC